MITSWDAPDHPRRDSNFHERLIMQRLSNELRSGLMLAAICLLLAACSASDDEQQSADSQPAEAVETASGNVIRRTVLFVTLRNKTGRATAAEYFGDERNSVHTGYCEVS